MAPIRAGGSGGRWPAGCERPATTSTRQRSTVAAPARSTLRPGITTESHGTEIADLLFFADLADVRLVGTSSGGMVVCRAAELAPDRIGRLVFVDALALDDG